MWTQKEREINQHLIAEYGERYAEAFFEFMKSVRSAAKKGDTIIASHQENCPAGLKEVGVCNCAVVFSLEATKQ